MRVFISADIEGIATTTLTEHGSKTGFDYDACRRQMSLEVAAACEGAFAAGADYIRVKDAHGSGTNIIPELLPRGVELTRSSCGSPYSMVYGVDEGFDVAMFVGYHVAAGRNGNPLAHTETRAALYVKLNGKKCSEFHLYSWACASVGVASIMLAGDEMLCEDSKGMHPQLVTVPVKRGFGGSTTSIHPEDACERIREGAKIALQQYDKNQIFKLPEHFTFEICFKEHINAVKASFYPGFKLIDDNTVLMETDNYWDVLAAVIWVL